jgi:uncharacterized protein
MPDVAMLIDGPAKAPLTLILAHGAGAPMDSPFMNTMACGLASKGVRVARFEFPYMAARRGGGRRGAPDREPALMASWREAVTTLGDPSRLVIGGKSLGGRIASMIADHAGVAGLVCLGYPFHPPGNPARTRVEHLRTLRTPGLIVQGTRDTFGRPDEVEHYGLSPAVRIVWIEDGDHSLRPRARSGRTEAQNLSDVVLQVFKFIADLRAGSHRR